MNVASLRALAEAATPGPWRADYLEISGMRYRLNGAMLADGDLCIESSGGARSYPPTICQFKGTTSDDANAALIAALDPQTVLKLLTVVGAARALMACDVMQPYIAHEPEVGCPMLPEMRDLDAALAALEETEAP